MRAAQRSKHDFVQQPKFATEFPVCGLHVHRLEQTCDSMQKLLESSFEPSRKDAEIVLKNSPRNLRRPKR